MSYVRKKEYLELELSNQFFPRNQVLAILPGTTHESSLGLRADVFATSWEQEGRISRLFSPEDRDHALHDVVRDVWLNETPQQKETSTTPPEKMADGGLGIRGRPTGGDINAVSVAEVPTRDGLIAHFILAEKNPMACLAAL